MSTNSTSQHATSLLVPQLLEGSSLAERPQSWSIKKSWQEAQSHATSLPKKTKTKQQFRTLPHLETAGPCTTVNHTYHFWLKRKTKVWKLQKWIWIKNHWFYSNTYQKATIHFQNKTGQRASWLNTRSKQNGKENIKERAFFNVNMQL